MTDSEATKILGGAFGLETPQGSSHGAKLPFAGRHMQLFLNVRCALLVLCEVHRPAAAWLPSYLCAALIEAFEIAGVKVRYYAVDGQLCCSEESVGEEIRPGDFLVLVHYFGFPQNLSLARKAYAQGAMVIEDASQALFLKQQFAGSICILYSPRKFLGVPDGALMVSASETGSEGTALSEPPRDWWKLVVRMALERRRFDLTGVQNDWFRLFRRAEAQMPVGRYRASDLSAMLLLEGLAFESIGQRRRSNYRRLLKKLGEYAIFPELDGDVVPLGFPVRVARKWRDKILHGLHAKNVFAPVHWPLADVVPTRFEASYELAKSSLTLICDQRYDTEDMERQAAEFELAVSEAVR